MLILDELDARGLLADVTDRDGLAALLASEIVTVYAGYDPTSPSLHIGNLIPTILLRRFQGLVAVLAEHDVRHLDFGEILEPPPGFDPGDYADRYGGTPSVANYLFYPQPPSAVTTTLL